MSDATVYAEDQFQGMWFANQIPDGAIDGPDVALWTTAPTDAPDTTKELAAPEYSRISTTSADWTVTNAGSPTVYANTVEFDFALLNPDLQVQIEGVVLVRPDNGECIYANDDVSKTIDAGDEFKIRAGDASFQID